MKVRLITLVGLNDTDIVPFFLDHYRALGVCEFHVTVHGEWTEKELAPLHASDVTIANVTTVPYTERLKVTTVNAMARQFPGEWLIHADADEFLEVPYRSLSRTINALQVLGIDELPAAMIQRAAPDGRLRSLADGDPQTLFPCYDFGLAERMGLLFRAWKDKYPLFRVGPKFQHWRGNHFPTSGHPVAHFPIRGAALHFKWRDRLLESVARVRGEEANQSEQDVYARWLAEHEDRAPTSGLKPYSREALFRDGHLIRPTAGEMRTRAALRRARALGSTGKRSSGRELAALGAIPHAAKEPGSQPDRHLDRRGLLNPPGRVAIVTNGLTGARVTGGVGTAYSALAKQLSAFGHEVHVFQCTYWAFPKWEHPMSDYWKARGCYVHHLRVDDGRHIELQDISLSIADALMAGDWDVIHFPDTAGFAAATLLLRSAGLAFQSSQVVITAHAPTPWHKRGNRVPWSENEAIMSELEAVTSKLADLVISPSAYMANWYKRHAQRPADLVIPNSLPGESRWFGRRPSGRRRISKIVFFGRMEHRKGIDRFLSAIDSVLARGISGFEVMFLGSFGPRCTGQDLAQATESWACRTQVFANYTSQEAIELLRQESCLAVLPSRVDNSPYTVYECLDNAIPFIATDVGGVAELIREEDRARALTSGDPEEIADKLVEALRDGAIPVRASFDPVLADIDLLSVHGNLIAAARQSRGRPAPRKVAEASIIVHGAEAIGASEPLTQWLVRASNEGHEVLTSASSAPAALNRLARAASRDRLFICRTSVLPDPEALTAMSRTMDAADADAVVCGYRDADGGRTSGAILGGPPELSSQQNVYGAELFLARKAAFVEAGGFSADVSAATIVEWELLNRMKATGHSIVGVPAPLATCRRSSVRRKPTAPQRSLLAAAWADAAPPELWGFLRMGLDPERKLQPSDPSLSGAKVRELGLIELIAMRHADMQRRMAAATMAAEIENSAQRLEIEHAVETDGLPLCAPDSLLDAIEPADNSERWWGRLRVGNDGRLLDGSGIYTVLSEDDAADCDFLVADDFADPRDLTSFASIFDDAERAIIGNGHDPARGAGRFLWQSELALTHPEAAERLNEIVARAIARTSEFYGLAAPLRADLVRLREVPQGAALGPSSASLIDPNVGRADLIGFSGFLFIGAARTGGELYFSGLDMKVRPTAGRLVVSTSGLHHEPAVLQVEDGASLLLSFSMRFESALANLTSNLLSDRPERPQRPCAERKAS